MKQNVGNSDMMDSRSGVNIVYRISKLEAHAMYLLTRDATSTALQMKRHGGLCSDA